MAQKILKILGEPAKNIRLCELPTKGDIIKAVFLLKTAKSAQPNQRLILFPNKSLKFGGKQTFLLSVKGQLCEMWQIVTRGMTNCVVQIQNVIMKQNFAHSK